MRGVGADVRHESGAALEEGDSLLDVTWTMQEVDSLH